MKISKAVQVIAIALALCLSGLANPAQARGFRIKHIPIVHFRKSHSNDSSSQPSQQEERKTNPWAKDEPTPEQAAAANGGSSGLMWKLVILLLFAASAIWGLFKFAVRTAQNSDNWSPSAPEGWSERKHSPFEARVQQQLLDARSGGSPAAPSHPAAPQGFGKRIG